MYFIWDSERQQICKDARHITKSIFAKRNMPYDKLFWRRKHGDKDSMPVLWGDIGEKLSNNHTQWYQQNRIYDADYIAMAHCANIPGGSYWYVIK